MFNLVGFLTDSRNAFSWQYIEGEGEQTRLVDQADPKETRVAIKFNNLPRFQHLPDEEVLGSLEDLLGHHGTRWLRPLDTASGEWEVDLDALSESFPDLFPMAWFTGKARSTPLVKGSMLGNIAVFEISG